tara:strand:+ start:114 stop:392 length:279 start_codon:yes stop_codon:yes gene_type:complete
MTDMMPAMASHLFYSILQNDPDEAAKIAHALNKKNPDEITQFLWILSALIAGYVRLFEKITPGQKNKNQIFCQMLKDFPVEKHTREHVSYRR